MNMTTPGIATDDAPWRKLPYHKLRALYPCIDRYIDEIAGQVRAGFPPEMTVGGLKGRIREDIRPEHQELLLERLTYLAHTVEQNRRAPPPPGTVFHPRLDDIAREMESQGHSICDYCNEYLCRLCALRPVTDWKGGDASA